MPSGPEVNCSRIERTPHQWRRKAVPFVVVHVTLYPLVEFPGTHAKALVDENVNWNDPSSELWNEMLALAFDFV